MTNSVQELLDGFDRLSESERREAASEILRRKSDELKLVDVIQLERLIEDSGLNENQKEYLRKRWLHQIRWWDSRAWGARKKYFRLRVIIVVGGVLVPFLTTASFREPIEPWIRRSAAVVSLVVAACAALEALYGWGAIWLEKRRAAELLKVEGWLLLHKGGRYKDQSEANAFPEFVTEVESQIAAEVGEYLAAAQPGQMGRKPGQPERDQPPNTPLPPTSGPDTQG